jgi:hypothetical protein
MNDKLFKVSDKITISCKAEKTRYGFRHLATLLKDGWIHGKAKACYYNRTWESFEFQSVIRDVAGKAQISADEKQQVLDYINKYKDEESASLFRSIGMVAAMGSILTDNQKDANSWKARMIKAGLNLDIPDDWDTLGEDEKESRLNKVIAELTV